jgi:GNAT superfamily N-acetyltransferase
MVLQLLAAEESDILDFASIWIAANAQDEVLRVINIAVDPVARLQWMHRIFMHRFRADPSNRHIKVIDTDTNQTIAAGVWKLPTATTKGSATASEKQSLGDVFRINPPPAGMNMELAGKFRKGMITKKAELWDEETTFGMHFIILGALSLTVPEPHLTERIIIELALVATLPEFQRRGAGRMIVNWGIERADQEGRKVWIKATVPALKLYQSFGWKEVDILVTDVTAYGGKGEHKIIFMYRDSILSS